MPLLKYSLRMLPRLTGTSSRLFSDKVQNILEDLIVTKAAADRIKTLSYSAGKEVKLRILVEGGGCSGFQYKYSLDDQPLNDDDLVFSRNEAKVVTDEISLDFIRGATVDYIQDLMKSGFSVTNNPNTESGCGCGSSFALKE